MRTHLKTVPLTSQYICSDGRSKLAGSFLGHACVLKQQLLGKLIETGATDFATSDCQKFYVQHT